MTTNWKLMTYSNVFLTIRETSFHVYSFDFITNKWLNDLMKSWSFTNIYYEKKNVTSWRKVDWILTEKLFSKFDDFFKKLIEEHKQNWWIQSLCEYVSNINHKKFVESLINEISQEYKSKDKEFNEFFNINSQS